MGFGEFLSLNWNAGLKKDSYHYEVGIGGGIWGGGRGDEFKSYIKMMDYFNCMNKEPWISE